MRASEIRNLLIQKYGMESTVVSKIIDKRELKELLLTCMVSHQTHEYRSKVFSTIMNGGYIVACAFLFFLALKPIIAVINSLRSNDKSTFKLKLIMRNVKRRNFWGAITMSLSIVLEVVKTAMSFSTFLSWVLPFGSPYRRFMVPMLSWPINPVAIIKNVASGGSVASAVTGATAQSAAAAGTYNPDIGPMITIWLVQWAVTWLEETSAATLMDRVHRRTKKAGRAAREHNVAGAASSSGGGAKTVFDAGAMLRNRSTDANWLDDGDGDDDDVGEVVDSSNIRRRATSAAERARDRLIVEEEQKEHQLRPEGDEDVPYGQVSGDIRRRWNSDRPSDHIQTLDATRVSGAYVDTSSLYSRADEVDICAAASIAGDNDDGDYVLSFNNNNNDDDNDDEGGEKNSGLMID